MADRVGARTGNRRGAGAAAVTLLTALAVLAVACVPPTGPGVGDVTGPGRHVKVWSVLPPGNGYPAGASMDHRDDQRLLYEGLDAAVARGGLSDADLGRHYKRADIDLPAGEERLTQAPRPGVRVRWDRWGVPYVEGDTALDVAFGAGWATMEGRALVAEIARVVGRRGGQELGTTDIFRAVNPDRRIDYTDAELEARLDALVAEHPVEGAAVVAELDAYLAGINAWIGSHPDHRTLLQLAGLPSGDWTRADVVAASLTVITGPATGGKELANAAALASLVDRLGPTTGRTAYADLRAADAPTTTHVAGPAAYPVFSDGSGPVAAPDPAAVAVPDDPTPAAAAAAEDGPRPERSNVIAVTADRSASGHPILVGGPQNGLTSPALLFEMSLVGGGIRSRGVVLPGGGPYVFVGRNDDSAWTSTSGETDQVDIRAERLCEPDGSPATTASRHYLFAGACRPFELPAGASPITVPRSVHGPVLGTGVVGGVPVAWTRQRASAGSEVLASVAVRRLNRNEVRTPAAFTEAMDLVTFSGHWFWVDDRHVAYSLTGRHPVRAAGVDPDLPSWGTGEWEWAGWVDPAQQPSAVDPAAGCLASWNNKVAPGWHTADDDWGNVGPHRVDLLVDRVCGRSGLTRADVVAAHNSAGATDLRGAEVLPSVLAVLEGSTAPDTTTEAVRAVLADWVAAGATRRDLDRDGAFDHPAVGVTDELVTRVTEGVFGPLLGPSLRDVPLRIDAGARTTGSSFGSGWYGLVTRDLGRLLGGPDDGAGLPVACGGGDLERCRAVLWAAVRDAGAVVAARQLPWDAAVPARWRTATLTNNGLIPFLPIVFAPVLMQWSNRPAFEQAVEFR